MTKARRDPVANPTNPDKLNHIMSAVQQFQGKPKPQSQQQQGDGNQEPGQQQQGQIPGVGEEKPSDPRHIDKSSDAGLGRDNPPRKRTAFEDFAL